MPEAPEFRVGNVMLGVRDMARSVGFYRDALGLPVRLASEEFTFLDGGGVALVLHGMRDLPEAPAVRRTEVVFHVEGIDAAHRALTERGVAFRIEPRIATGARATRPTFAIRTATCFRSSARGAPEPGEEEP
jgi:catechol 2,3-dioxygenase-like lactoylglutathione lyase family enzyme